LSADHSELNVTGLDLAQDGIRVQDGHAHVNGRVLCMEGRQRLRQQVLAGYRAGGYDQFACDLVVLSRDVCPGVCRKVQDSAGVVVQPSSGFGEFDPAGFAVEEGRVKQRLQVLDALADCCLRNTKMTRGGREAAALGCLGECVQIWQRLRAHCRLAEWDFDRSQYVVILVDRASLSKQD
jgi:hypothetical protein